MTITTDLLRRAADLLRIAAETAPTDVYRNCHMQAASLLALADKWERAEPVYTACWNHGCNALCAEIDLWVNRCPHCGKPAPQAAMQEPKP